jgi:hypothetical protein
MACSAENGECHELVCRYRIQEVVGGLEPPGGSLDRDFPGGSGRDKNIGVTVGNDVDHRRG